MKDETEEIRKLQQAQINAIAGSREHLELHYGKVWSTDQLREDFEVLGFLAPYVVVRNHKTGKKGSFQFQHSPRFYFNFLQD